MQKRLRSPKPVMLCVLSLLVVNIVSAQSAGQLPTPSPQQQLWQDMEITMFIHFAPNTWQEREFDNHSTPLEKINPTKLDVNQWIDAAESIDAKMILFVAKHVGGFCMWQTDTSEYSIKNTPYKNGKGDILKELSEACWQRGMKLGVYIYPGDGTWGAYLGGGGRTSDPSKQEAYNQVLRQQWTEVLSRYGKVTEIWFDGSCIIPLDDIVQKHAPDTIILQSPMANIRWVGNERGFAPYPAWNAVKKEDADSGVATAAHGDPDGDTWMPLEVNTTLKDHYWFWSPKNNKHLKTVGDLLECYYKSVGRGGLFLLNAAPDTTGLIPEEDMKIYRQFGEEVRKRFGTSLSEASGKGNVVELDLGKLTKIDHAVAMEDIAFGERVREYVIEGKTGDDEWFEIIRGSAVGHKRIDRFEPTRVSKVRFRSTQSAAIPVIRKFAVYHIGDEKEYNKLKSTKDDFGNPWNVGTSKKTEDLKVVGDLKSYYDADSQMYVIDLSKVIDEAAQYELFIRKPSESLSLRAKNPGIWLEGIETPGFCKLMKAGNPRIDINITAVPTGEKGSIVVKFNIPNKTDATEKVYIRKVIYK